MNIIVRTYRGKIVVRPDTSWVRKDEDFYVPDFVDSLGVSRVLSARISRPGKCISERFAERYFDAMGRGLLFYPENMLDGEEESYAQACGLGHSTYIKMPDSDKSAFSETERKSICVAIEQATRFALVRTGDIIAVEEKAPEHLCSRADEVFETGNFNIIF